MSWSQNIYVQPQPEKKLLPKQYERNEEIEREREREIKPQNDNNNKQNAKELSQIPQNGNSLENKLCIVILCVERRD